MWISCVANLRILEVKEVKTVPYVLLSHPFVERLIGHYGGSFSTRCRFGTLVIWNGSGSISRTTLTASAPTMLWEASRPP